MEEKIKKILLKKLSYAYCDNCNNCGTEDCDDCHRKMQNWSLSSWTAEELSKEILELIKYHNMEVEYDEE